MATQSLFSAVRMTRVITWVLSPLGLKFYCHKSALCWGYVQISLITEITRMTSTAVVPPLDGPQYDAHSRSSAYELNRAACLMTQDMVARSSQGLQAGLETEFVTNYGKTKRVFQRIYFFVMGEITSPSIILLLKQALKV